MIKKDIVFIFILIIILFGLYWKTFNYELIWDDDVFFSHNLLFIENHPITAALKYGYFGEQLGVSHQDHYYRPLLTASFLLENKLWGIKNVTLRLTNLLIFILSLIFLFYFLKNQSDQDYFPEISTLLFALYPLNIDNIVWIVGRGDLFLLLWGALTFFFLELFHKQKKTLFLVGSSLFFLFGIFSKETFLFIFLLLILYEFFKYRKITYPYHLANLGAIFLFFILKSVILRIANVKIVYYPNALESLQAIIGTLGYYFRTIIFPISYDMFLSIHRVRHLLYVIFGLLALFFMVFFFYRSKKDKRILMPLFLFCFFLIGHILLIFTSVYPYQIYSRYMMIPSLGFAWILASFLIQIKEKTRFFIVFLILLAFIPSIVLNANSYNSKMSFWQRAQKSSPNDAYVLFQLAKTYQDKKDYLSAELALNKSLSLTMKKETAMLVSLLYADIEMAKADYDKVFRWLNSIEEFENTPNVIIAPFMRYQISAIKARVYSSKGDVDLAEKVLEENLSKFSAVKESYSDLYRIYTSHEQWEKAASLEKTMKKIFPSFFSQIDTAKMKEAFEELPLEKKMSFYILNRNFPKAIALVRTLPTLDLDHQLLLAQLYYLQGDAEAGEKIIQEIIEAQPANYEILNKIGSFYLSNLFRAKDALNYIDKSLSLNPNQPEILHLSNRLKNDYLNKLTEVWK